VARPHRRQAAICQRALGPAEALRLQDLHPAIREREFLRMWTRHEATLKCRGFSFDAKIMRAWRASHGSRS
jgi:phosphopantetheinyl transferase